MTHVWRWRKHRGDRHGQPCRIICAGRGNAMVEFADGEQVIAPRWAVRRRETP